MTTPTTYTARIAVECPFCYATEMLGDTELPRDEPYVAATTCSECEHNYRYVVDNTHAPSRHPHVVCLRESEYRAIRDEAR